MARRHQAATTGQRRGRSSRPPAHRRRRPPTLAPPDASRPPAAPEAVARHARLVVKLLRLVPMEYRAGVRDGQIAVPLEYREAVSFTVQAEQILVELRPNWLRNKSQALSEHGSELEQGFATLEDTIAAKGDALLVEKTCKTLSALLQDRFGVSLRKAGKGSDV